MIVVECDYDPKQIPAADLAGDIATDLAVHFSRTSSPDDAYNLADPQVSVEEWGEPRAVRVVEDVAWEEGGG